MHLSSFVMKSLVRVPSTEGMAAMSVTDPSANSLWDEYLERWTMWNHARTVSAMVAVLPYLLGLILIDTT